MHPDVKRFAVLVLAVAAVFVAASYVMNYQLGEIAGQDGP